MPLLGSATRVVAQGYGGRKGKLDHDLRSGGEWGGGGGFQRPYGRIGS